MAQNIGKIVQVIGPVIDVEFEPSKLPDLYNALMIEDAGNGRPAVRVVAEGRRSRSGRRYSPALGARFAGWRCSRWLR